MNQYSTFLFLVFALFHFHLLYVSSFPLRVLSGTQVRSTGNSNVRIVTKCFPGMYIKIDCKMYFDCDKGGQFRRNFCDHGTYWNHRDKKCDQIQNVPECVAVYASKPENGSQPVGQESPSPSTEKSPIVELTKSLVSIKGQSQVRSTEQINVASMAKESAVKQTPSSTESPIITSTTIGQNVTNFEGEDEDYIDPPNSDWDIDGVLGLVADNSKSVTSGNAVGDIIPDDSKSAKILTGNEDGIEVNKVDNEAPVFGTANTDTHGKTCILRGKSKVCNPVDNGPNAAMPAVYSDQVFSQQANTTEAISTTVAPSNSTCSQSKGNSIVYDFSLHISVHESAIRFVRTIAYYVNFTIVALSTS